MKAIDFWLSEVELQTIYSADYWNNIEEEKKKEWWIENGDYDRCLRYLDASKLMLEYQEAEGCIKEMRRENLRVLDLAAGIGWTSALLSKLDCVADVHAVEISRHRLELLFPHAMSMLDARDNKIQRHLGSFYDLRFSEQSIDVIFLAQAFHHADRPLHLLVECDRVLNPGGRMLLIGEPQIRTRQIVKRMLGTFLKKRRMVADFYELFPTDRESGDHYYKLSDYYFMFRSMGYEPTHKVLPSGNIIYIADKR
ncbi:MAG TPA: class I SAM-dependent methyltransferase [Gemmatimonadaceae bacterium]|nr:class I SAM-dependent methyltransferase [Gemmatimonadaceae bacterium]